MASMVVFGCGAGVKGLSAASRRHDMALRPCRARFDCCVNKDQDCLTQAVGAILREAKSPVRRRRGEMADAM